MSPRGPLPARRRKIAFACSCSCWPRPWRIRPAQGAHAGDAKGVCGIDAARLAQLPLLTTTAGRTPSGTYRTRLRRWRPVRHRCHPLAGDDRPVCTVQARRKGVPNDGRSELSMEATMSDADVELGPVDYLMVAFPTGQAKFSGAMASELKALMDSNTVRVLDLLLRTKNADGSAEASELRDADDSEVGQLRAGRGRSRGALGRVRMSRRSARCWSRSARLRCWCGRTRGQPRSVQRCAVGWPTGDQRPHPDPSDLGCAGRGPRRQSARGVTCRR